MRIAARDTVRRAAANLNAALADYESTSASLALDFRELKLQVCIFQFDICSEMAGLVSNHLSGFAASVALKGLVLRLYEYDQLLSKQLIARLLALARARGITIDSTDFKAQRKRWKSELNRLRGWEQVRNEAAGHYGANLERQVTLLKALNKDEVMAVTQAFLQFNRAVLETLRNAGRGPDA